MFYCKPQFYGVRGAAANIGVSRGNYTEAEFQADHPQFFKADGTPLLPPTMLAELVKMANAAIQPDKWGEMWRYAVGLYVAHYATLYLRSYAPSNETAQQAAASGAVVGVVRGATLGDASIQYDTGAITAGTEDWGDLNSTTYGQQLASRARMVGLAGTLVI